MNAQVVERAVTPLRLVFWGGLLCLLDVAFTSTTNGRGFRIDVLNDAVGALLVAVGVFRLRAAPVHDRYALAMTFVLAVSGLSVLDAVRSHFVLPLAPPVLTALTVLGFLELVAIVTFCAALRWFCLEARLREAARSWSVTLALFGAIYFVPLGVLHAFWIVAIASGESIPVGIAIVGLLPPLLAVLLLLPLFALPLIHLFVSTSRTKRAAKALPLASSGAEDEGGTGPSAA
jgi:hypothetical protein